jgi:triphosphoribosyl-dephospho-CoA synthase
MSDPLLRRGRQTQTALAPHEAIGALAAQCLTLEIETWPKPGLVSHIDNGSHRDMDANLLRRSAAVLSAFFTRLAQAGADDAAMDRLRMIGIEAETAMLAATRGINTHRGAIFGLGLLCAAAGRRGAGLDPATDRLGAIVRRHWGEAISHGPIVLHSHGTKAARLHGAPGARGEAAAGFPSIYDIALPALADGDRITPYDPEAVRVHAIFALIARVKDTNILHRGGAEGLAFARTAATEFVRHGGIARHGWRLDAAFVHAEFVKRRLSPGGAADLLAMSLFVRAQESAGRDAMRP